MSQWEDTIENNTKLWVQEKNKPNEMTPEDNEVNIRCTRCWLTSNKNWGSRNVIQKRENRVLKASILKILDSRKIDKRFSFTRDVDQILKKEISKQRSTKTNNPSLVIPWKSNSMFLWLGPARILNLKKFWQSDGIEPSSCTSKWWRRAALQRYNLPALWNQTISRQTTLLAMGKLQSWDRL